MRRSRSRARLIPAAIVVLGALVAVAVANAAGGEQPVKVEVGNLVITANGG